jgi:hypothetical protein
MLLHIKQWRNQGVQVHPPFRPEAPKNKGFNALAKIFDFLPIF